MFINKKTVKIHPNALKPDPKEKEEEKKDKKEKKDEDDPLAGLDLGL